MLLWDRATHVFFLRELAKHKSPSSPKLLGDIPTWQVVKELVRPATAHTKTDFVQCLVGGQLPPSYSLPWCNAGGRMPAPGPDGASPQPQAMFGPTTYFASHAWSYKFAELVDLLEAHYSALPQTHGGSAYVPVFYWVDILAVTQHFTGDFKDHPDSNFPGVIKASQAVLFTMHPWRSPVAPTRVWCLFEALTAVQSEGVGLEVLLDTRDSADTRPQTLLAIVSSINVMTAQATVASDKAYIMGCIARGLGAAAFNATLKRLLRTALLDTMLRKAFKAARAEDDGVSYGPMVELLKMNGRHLPNSVVDVPKLMPYAAPADIVSLVSSYSAANCPRVLVLSGRDGCTEERHRRHVGGAEKDWAIDYYSACLKLWSYMPLSNKAIGALGRMLARIASGEGGGSGGGGAAAGVRPSGGVTSKSSSSTTTTTTAAAIGGSGLRAASSSSPMVSSSSVSPAHSTPAVKSPIAGRRAGLAGGGVSTSATPAAALAAGSRAAPIAGRRAAGGVGSTSSGSKTSSTPTVIATSAATTAAAPPPPPPAPVGATAGDNDGDDPSAGGGSGGGPGLQELFLRLGNAGIPIRWRQPCSDSDKGIFTAEEVAKAAKPESFRAWMKKKDPNWKSIHEMGFPKHLIKMMKIDWQEKEEFEKWRDEALTELAVQRAAKDASARAAAERAERAERAELWRGLAAYGGLRVLCLHRSVLCSDDVTQLQGVLRASRGVRELLLIECEAEEEGTTSGVATRGRGFGAAGSTAPLTRRLLAATLGGGGGGGHGLQRLTITPPRLAALEELDAGMGGGGGGGGAPSLQELVLAPVALGPKAVKQLAEVLAALPALRAGAVDSLKAPPLTAPPAAPADEMRADVTQPYKPPQGYPTKVPGEMLRKIDWRVSYPHGTTHEVLRSTRSPDLSYYPQYDSPVAAAEVAALAHVLQLAPTGGAASHNAQRVAVLSHWLSAVAAGPGPAAAAVARGKAAAARNSAIVPDAGEEVSVDDSVLETDFEVGPGGVEARMAALQAAGRELEAESLKAAGGCAYASCWPHLVPPSRRRELLGPDAERLLADAPKPPPLRAATAGAAPALGWGSGSLPGLLGGGSGGGGFGSLLAAAAAAAAAAAEAAPVGGGGGGGVGAAAAAVDSDDSDDDFSDLDQIGWRPQPGLKWEG